MGKYISEAVKGSLELRRRTGKTGKLLDMKRRGLKTKRGNS